MEQNDGEMNARTEKERMERRADQLKHQ